MTRLLRSPHLLFVIAGLALAVLAWEVPGRANDADLRLTSELSGALTRVASSADDDIGFKVDRIIPGGGGTGELALTNHGADPATYELVPEAARDVAGAFGGSLSGALELAIHEVQADGTLRLLFAGKLGTLRDPIALGEIAPRATRRLRMTVDLPQGGAPPTQTTGDNAFIGAATSVVYAIRVTRPDAAVAPQQVQLAQSRTCLSRRQFRIRLRVPKRFAVRSTRVFVDGKRVAVQRGRRLRALVDLRGKPKGSVVVSIAVRGRNGRTLTGTRRYLTCTPKIRSKRLPRL